MQGDGTREKSCTFFPNSMLRAFLLRGVVNLFCTINPPRYYFNRTFQQPELQINDYNYIAIANLLSVERKTRWGLKTIDSIELSTAIRALIVHSLPHDRPMSQTLRRLVVVLGILSLICVNYVMYCEIPEDKDRKKRYRRGLGVAYKFRD